MSSETLQHVIVTIVALVAVAGVIRLRFRSTGSSPSGGCGPCASAGPSCSMHGTHARVPTAQPVRLWSSRPRP